MSTLAASASSSRTTDKPPTRRSRSHASPSRKTRIARRRRRAKDGLESEDELVREVGTDSETEDDLSSTDSDSDSDTEPVSEGAVAHGRSRPLTPSTSDSPQSHNKEIPARIDDNPQPFFTQPTTWGDMVMEENAHGAAELPVIDFADFHVDAIPSSHASRPLSRKSKRRLDGSRDRSPQSETHEDGQNDVDHRPTSPRRSRSLTSKRPLGQSARQAYQERLENDPSFVPTVGGFWGHDERLLDKDLRSLSGWWRGRWQSRGRGRGFGLRVRGGHTQSPSPHDADASGPTPELPPIERTWTHDGYEEMKRREEQRRATSQQQQQANQTRGVRGARGGFAAGRGGRIGSNRGGLVSSPARSNMALAHGGVWYDMKPERMWTKQHEAFLFFDSSTKPRRGQGLSYKVKVPGTEVHSVLALPRVKQADTEWKWSQPKGKVLDTSTVTYIIRIPKSTPAAKAIESLTTVEETSLEEIFTVRPNLVTPIPIPMPHTVSGPSVPTKSDKASTVEHEQGSVLFEQQSRDSTESKGPDQALTGETTQTQPSPEQPSTKHPSTSSDQRPTLPPLQTVFTPPPVAHPSPAYGAAYSYGPSLPPGVALNAHGIPYELATGRPVYLAAAPMYTPRPMVPSHLTPGAVPFIPSHMHHSSISPDFMSQGSSHTPPMNGFVDSTTETPLFSLPRQTRISIRAPADESDGKGSRKGQLRQSGAATRTPTVSSPLQALDPSSQTYYPSLTRPSETAASPPYNGAGSRDGQASNGQDPQMASYPPYQPYYYPGSYGYYPYMDMSQVGQYDMYSSDPRGAQGSVYY